jgi:hypothetical protein
MYFPTARRLARHEPHCDGRRENRTDLDNFASGVVVGGRERLVARPATEGL